MRRYLYIVAAQILAFAFQVCYAQTTQVFTYTGANQTFHVPCDVTSINVQLWGAGGGAGGESNNYYSAGGPGGYVAGTMAVTAGSVLNIVVGGAGNTATNAATYGGGGQMGDFAYYDGSGGGRSAIQVTAGTDDVTAGGGGGAGEGRYNTTPSQVKGWSYGGAGGGNTGGTGGAGYESNGGTGGAQAAGGSGGCYTGLGCGGNGSSQTGGIGGYGGAGDYPGGGGGGGYYGGGGGSGYFAAGGGGGSSYIGILTGSTNTQGTADVGQTGASMPAPNNADPNYVAGIGVGGGGSKSAAGGNGLVVITYVTATQQATNFTETGSPCGATSLTVNWTRGNGNNVMVVCTAGAPSTGPTNGTAYTANTVFGAGTACGGGYCVYNGTGTSVTVTGLTAGTTYYFDIYEYYTVGLCYFTPSLESSIATLNSNDNYNCATALTVGAGATAGTTAGATIQSNESFACNNASDYPGHTVTQTVWYNFVASANGTDYVQINLTAGCYANFGATIWDPSIVSQSGSTYQTTANPYCGMISCQSMSENNAASNPFLFQLCNLTAGNTYYIQVISGNEGGCGGSTSFNIAVTNGNPGGTITNPCHPNGQVQSYINSSLSTAGAGPIAECYINACLTAPSCPSCTSYTLNGAGGETQDNVVWNAYYSFTTAAGCSNDLEFQECISSTCISDGFGGNVSWMSFQLYTTSGACITSGDLSNADSYGYMGIPGVGCSNSYVLQYTSEQIPCTDYYYFTPFTDNYGSSSCTLPIVLIRFTANEDNESNVDLNWATATETDNNYFTVERSLDGQNFMNIGKVKATGNSTSIINYKFIDTTASELAQNLLYYRLSQTDINGNTNDFNVVEVNMNKNFSVSVYPNPSSGDFNIDYTVQQGSFMKVDLVDATGNTVSSKYYMGSGGLQHQTLQPPQSGMYILTITINGQVLHKKIVKL